MIARLIIAGAAVLALGTGVATAGPCTKDINDLSSKLGWRDAGSGPTPGSATTTTQSQAPAHPPTSVMNKAMEGTAASAQDANRQTTGQPTAAAQSQGAKATTPNDQSEAKAALERARQLDAQGNNECNQALQEARRLVGHVE